MQIIVNILFMLLPVVSSTINYRQELSLCISASRWRLPSISCCWQFSNTDDQFHTWSTSIFILLQSLHEHNQWNSILTNIMISFQSIPFSIICLIFIRINQIITLLVSGPLLWFDDPIYIIHWFYQLIFIFTILYYLIILFNDINYQSMIRLST